ncbi:MAG TPA: helix-turn-helix transcriptional regulator [Hypericibacter adhaerens]|uniref:Helix-turn-helix transcriptional regulator n=1 Tax=Hypericibacter adhaerens TaxID=2602016 RepID=A0A5J6N8G2_9PROT|nr:helix-turn-helix transcriptional regulator [Hypericibacter adhaerens]QEX25270.1 helix-turn-helix transcriptional regulator [Hypericibacter adhaerens]HWA44296.1 helix-turn-helix transcriptional regulator [Hypericibacter adhaerens]
MSALDPDWHRNIAAALTAMETPDFAPALVRALAGVAEFDFSVIFGYRGEARPIDLFDNFPAHRRDVFVTDYQAGPYLLDPFYHASRSRVPSGLHRMRELAPDRFYQSQYYRSYYARTGLAEEIGFFFAPSADATVVISLMRDGHRTVFPAREMNRLHLVAPVVIAAAERNWRRLEAEPAAASAKGPPGSDGLPSGPDLVRLFDDFGQRPLTRREREVGALVLRGHSSEAIARQLKIASGTVKIHRKNIYAKLGIASQAELFSMFLSALTGKG